MQYRLTTNHRGRPTFAHLNLLQPQPTKRDKHGATLMKDGDERPAGYVDHLPNVGCTFNFGRLSWFAPVRVGMLRSTGF